MINEFLFELILFFSVFILILLLISSRALFKIETKIISMYDIVTNRKYGLDNELGILCTYMGFSSDEAYEIVLNHLKKERDEWKRRENKEAMKQ